MRAVLFSIIFIILTSCAIHKKFPFICFERACVIDQLHIRELKSVRKNMKAKAIMRQKKRDAKHRKEKDNEEKMENEGDGYVEINIDIPKKERNDSVLSYSFKQDAIGIDTVIISRSFIKEDSIRVEEELFLKKYIAKHNAGKVTQIVLQEFYVSDDRHRSSHRLKNILNYLKELGISPSVFIIKKAVKLKNESTDERVEIRIR